VEPRAVQRQVLTMGSGYQFFTAKEESWLSSHAPEAGAIEMALNDGLAAALAAFNRDMARGGVACRAAWVGPLARIVRTNDPANTITRVERPFAWQFSGAGVAADGSSDPIYLRSLAANVVRDTGPTLNALPYATWTDLATVPYVASVHGSLASWRDGGAAGHPSRVVAAPVTQAITNPLTDTLKQLAPWLIGGLVVVYGLPLLKRGSSRSNPSQGWGVRF
jgi:hypothetical protein